MGCFSQFWGGSFERRVVSHETTHYQQLKSYNNLSPQHSHSRTAVRNSRREVDMNVYVVLYLRACTYRYRCLISKICVFLTQIFLDMCIAVCLPGQLADRYSFVYQTIFSTCFFTIMNVIYSLHYYPLLIVGL